MNLIQKLNYNVTPLNIFDLRTTYIIYHPFSIEFDKERCTF